MGCLWIALSQLHGAALVIPLMMVRGTFFTLQSISITLLVARISHPAHVATNQALAQVTIPGSATLLTGYIAGRMFDLVGARTLFQLGALMAGLAAVVLIATRKQLAGRTDQASGL